MRYQNSERTQVCKNLHMAEKRQADPYTAEMVKRAGKLMEYLYIGEDADIYVCVGKNSTNILYAFEGNTKRTVKIQCLHENMKVICTRTDADGQKEEWNTIIQWENMHEAVNLIKLIRNESIWNPVMPCTEELDRKDGPAERFNIQKACLFTGAFNPPTIAHYNMVDVAKTADHFDYFIYAASSQQFLEKKQKKTGGGAAFSEEQRLRMLLLMTRDRPDVLVYGIEHGYTYDVLKDTKERYCIRELYFALGSDKLKEIGRWGNHNELLREFCFYIVQRKEHTKYIKEECERLFSETAYTVSLHKNDYYGISATQVRDAIKNGKEYRDLVTQEVYEDLRCIQYASGV